MTRRQSRSGGQQRPSGEDAVRAATGRVLACFRDEWEVAIDGGGTARATVRGRHFVDLPKDAKLIVPGDRVDLALHADGSTTIESIHERRTVLSRRLPEKRRAVEQIIIANADRLVAVASLGVPSLNRRMLDRFLVIAEDAELVPVVVLNKIDLVPEDEWRPHARAYESAGYQVLPTCALDGRGVDKLADVIEDGFSVFAGPSGAGKSSLLNAVEPGLGLRVREVSEKTRKGRHTTSNVTLFRLEGGALVADTPGFRELGFFGIRADDLDYYFPEFRRHIADCRFAGCSHVPEPGCAVKGAVARGEIDEGRYESYRRLLAELSGRPPADEADAPPGEPPPM